MSDPILPCGPTQGRSLVKHRSGAVSPTSVGNGGELRGFEQLADRRIVDLRSERAGNRESSGYSDTGLVHGGPQDKRRSLRVPRRLVR